MKDDERYARGLRLRRAVLGAAHVDRTVRATTDLDREFQHLLTRYVWGEVWTRPGLPRKTRRLLTLAMLVALNRDDELALHVRAALAGGVTRDELKEVLLQAAVYCGIPAARSAFQVAAEVLAEGRPAAAPASSKTRRASTRGKAGRRLVRKSPG